MAAPVQFPACDDCAVARLKASFDAQAATRSYERELRKAQMAHRRAWAVAEHEAKLTREANEATALQANDLALTAELLKSQRAAEVELNKLYHTTIADIAKGAIDRSRDSAKFVQTASAAIFALYTGLLALVFSVTDNPLPLRGVWAGVFLALSVALATAYLAFLKDPDALRLSLPGQSLTQLQHARTAYLTRWVNTTVNSRRWALRASVLSLAFGAAFVAAPFVSSGERTKIPELPAAPAVPAAIAAAVEEHAIRLMNLQVDDYERAVAARSEALAAAADEVDDTANRERLLNWIVAGLALAAVAVVAFGPVIYDRRRGC